MRKFNVTGFRYGVYCTITIATIPECVAMRAAERGMTEIIYIEEESI